MIEIIYPKNQISYTLQIIHIRKNEMYFYPKENQNVLFVFNFFVEHRKNVQMCICEEKNVNG